jgi:hypothetical protein
MMKRRQKRKLSKMRMMTRKRLSMRRKVRLKWMNKTMKNSKTQR